MQQIVSRITAQLSALAQQYPEAAAEYGSPTLNAGAAETDFAELENVLGYENGYRSPQTARTTAS
mgnify:CR=1 FL=1